jgi:hypothetical protein
MARSKISSSATVPTEVVVGTSSRPIFIYYKDVAKACYKNVWAWQYTNGDLPLLNPIASVSNWNVTSRLWISIFFPSFFGRYHSACIVHLTHKGSVLCFRIDA